MKTRILLFPLFIGTLATAQRSGIYAVTDVNAGGVSWQNIRETSQNGDGGKLLMANAGFAGTRVEVQTQQKRSIDPQSLSSANDQPFNTGVAALA
ncbi:MAG TPA: hypothetical protein VK907_02725, partial [Phnomibacter sp.]|nr:hypothetical protein [Phnomibacter sp.]